jgi:hypothetical protein
MNSNWELGDDADVLAFLEDATKPDERPDAEEHANGGRHLDGAVNGSALESDLDENALRDVATPRDDDQDRHVAEGVLVEDHENAQDPVEVKAAGARDVGRVAIADGAEAPARKEVVLWEEHPPDAPDNVKDVLRNTVQLFGTTMVANRQGDGVTSLLIIESANLDRTQAADGRTSVGGRPDVEGSAARVIEPDLDVARRDPSRIAEMIQHAPRSEFHDGVMQAEKDGRVAEFEGRFGKYAYAGLNGARGRDGEQLMGFWDRLRLSSGELETLRHVHTRGKTGLINRNNQADIGKVRIAYQSALNTGNKGQVATGDGGKRQVGAGSWTSTAEAMIDRIDEQYRGAKSGARDGMASPLGSPDTQARREHLLALQMPHETGNPGTDGEEAKEFDQMKLELLRSHIDLQWAEARHQVMLQDPEGFAAGTHRMTEVPDNIRRLEELYTALAVRYESDDARAQQLLRSGVIGWEKTVAKLRGDAANRADSSGRLGGTYTEYDAAAFRLDVIDKGMQWKSLTQNEAGRARAAQHLTKASEQLAGRILGIQDHEMRAAGKEVPAGGFLSAEARAIIGEEGYKELLRDAMRGAIQDAAAKDGGYVTQRALDVQAEIAQQLAAAMHDPDGTKKEAQETEEARLARLSAAEDNPPEGRRLIVVGNVRREDGNAGLLELLALMGGNDEHLDSFGNTPFRDPFTRSDAQRAAASRGINTQVHRPLDRILPERQWENVHFVGRQPDGYTPRHVLGPIAPNGLGTIEAEINWVNDDGDFTDDSLYVHVLEAINPDREAYAANPLAFPYAYQFRAEVIPTRVLRVLKADAGGLDYSLDHENEDFAEVEEHTLALFRNKEDGPQGTSVGGSPSDLYVHLLKKYATPRSADVDDDPVDAH